MGRIVTTLVLVVAGAVWYAIAGEDPQIASCVQQVDRVAAAYRSHPPKAESHKAIESALKHSRTWCGDKKFKDAILAYQKYRDGNPKGRHYGEATFKMGVCFQEMGLKDEAKVFYEEVISKFPGSKDAKKAAVRAKQLK